MSIASSIKQGVESAEAASALHEVDWLVQKLRNRVEVATGADPVTWMIVSDHGFQNMRKQFNPRVGLIEQGLIKNTKQGKLKSGTFSRGWLPDHLL